MKITDYKKQIINEDSELAKKLEEDIPHQVGKMLVEARLLTGFTQERLAKLAHTQQPSIARIENGASSPNLAFLKKVVNAMGLTLLPPRIAELDELKYVGVDYGTGMYYLNNANGFISPSLNTRILDFA